MRAFKTATIFIVAIGLLAVSAVGVAAQNAVVSGTITSGEDCVAAPDGPDGAQYCTGGTFEFDDPRLTGDFDSTSTTTEAFGASGEGFVDAFIATEDLSLTNDDGSWSGRFLYAFILLDDESLPEAERIVEAGGHWLLTGEGGYEGLTAYLDRGPEGVRGIILETEQAE